jgi:hypothetical protein
MFSKIFREKARILVRATQGRFLGYGTVIVDFPSFVILEPKQMHHSATTWNVPEVLGA